MEIKDKIINSLKCLYGVDEQNHFSYCSYPFEECRCRDIKTITHQTSLIGEGYIDSMGLILLIKTLEHQFSIKIDEKFIIPNNFDTVEKIENIIKKHIK